MVNSYLKKASRALRNAEPGFLPPLSILSGTGGRISPLSLPEALP